MKIVMMMMKMMKIVMILMIMIIMKMMIMMIWNETYYFPNMMTWVWVLIFFCIEKYHHHLHHYYHHHHHHHNFHIIIIIIFIIIMIIKIITIFIIFIIIITIFISSLSSLLLMSSYLGNNKFQQKSIIEIKQDVLTDTILKGDHPRIISAKVGWDWLSSFRGEEFF
jgi:hypothetical protein